MQQVSVHYYISGDVQGVYYRSFSKSCARQFNLVGWVRNLEDGRVEVLVSGDTKSLQDFEQCLRKGPPSAKVTSIESTRVPFEYFEHFSIIG